MKKMEHYLKCLYELTKKVLITFLRKLSFESRKIFAVIRTILRVYRKSSSNNAETLDLQTFYPDCGHLANSSGFTFKECSFDLSIIIPAYNVSQYIDECITSILTQKTLYTYEVIIVDDGSTDDTAEIINKYLTNSKVQFIKQQNLGQSAARNKAISISKGRYLMFVDGDDILLPNAINALMNAANDGSDIVEGNVVRFYDKITDEMLIDSTSKSFIKSYCKDPSFVLICKGYSVAKVYKRELWETLRFPEGYIFEDVITKFILRRKANKVKFIGEPVYGYRWNLNSSSHGKSSLKKLDSIWVLDQIVKLCEKECAPKDNIFYLLCLNHIGILNYVAAQNQNRDIKLACFAEMKRQLNSVKKYCDFRLPFMFQLLETSILCGSLEQWECVAETITKFDMLKKWRERN